MSERKFELKVFGIDYVCDECGAGAMLPSGIMLMSNPPQWPHTCNHCGHEQTFGEKYPTIRYEKA